MERFADQNTNHFGIRRPVDLCETGPPVPVVGVQTNCAALVFQYYSQRGVRSMNLLQYYNGRSTIRGCGANGFFPGENTSSKADHGDSDA